jgi:hypothetical protein
MERRRWTAAVLVATFVAMTSFAADAGAAAGRLSADRGLQLVGGATRTVRFVAGAARTVLTVRNASDGSGRLELVFVSRNGDREIVLPSRPGQGPSPISVLDPGDLRRPLAAGGLRQIELRLGLRAGQAPADGGGLVEARISSSSAPPVAMTIRGAGADLAFDPPSLTMGVTRGCWLIRRACGNSATVLMRGRDAVLWAQRARVPHGVAILNNSQGGSVTVRLRDIEVQDGAVRATVEADNDSMAGRYLGRLPIEPDGLAGPSLRVDVKVRWSLAAAVLVIFAGALFGGFFLRRFEIRRRRRLLELELLSALNRYDEERARSGERPAGYDLDRLLEPRLHDEAATTPYPGTRGVSALLWHIRTARDDADFSEDIERTHALIAAIERWLALEPVVRETARLLDGDAPPRDAGRLSDTLAYRDLAYLLVRATTAPEDDDACERLIGALASQGRVAVKCEVVWELLAELESRTGWLPEQAGAIAEFDLLAVERRYPAFEQRTAEQTDQLLVTLAQAKDCLRRLHGDTATLDERACAVEADRVENLLDAPARNPSIERGTLDLSPWRLRLAGAFSSLALRAVVWTLARALVAAAAYALTIYSDTWGSVTDFASAFTAGFLTETIVNWAVMPAFHSNRNRSGASAQAGAIPKAPALAALIQPLATNGKTSALFTEGPHGGGETATRDRRAP